jgi:glucokinase
MANTARPIYVGTDCGATTSKIVAVYDDGTPVSTKLLQRKTRSSEGRDAVVQGWVDAVGEYLAENGLSWDQVRASGLATPGPYQRYGVLDKSANLPADFEGFDVHNAYSSALAAKVGRQIPVVVGNDGNLGGVAEAQRVRGNTNATVVMLAPGSGLGAAYVDGRGLPLDGDTLAGMEGGHVPAPLHLLNVPAYPCGCGRTWGCIEVYTSLAGLPYLLEAKLKEHPNHELAKSPLGRKEKAFALRGLAQKGDRLAQELFDFQAIALGHFVAMLAMALDPKFFVIGGGLMDPESTAQSFRDRYLKLVTDTAHQNFFPAQKRTVSIVPASLGELSQAIGAALVGLYSSRA